LNNEKCEEPFFKNIYDIPIISRFVWGSIFHEIQQFRQPGSLVLGASAMVLLVKAASNMRRTMEISSGA
jgi:hypothetical protein